MRKALDQEPAILINATGADMATAIAHRACGVIHDKNPASNAKGNETAANAVMELLAASPTPINMAIPNRPMNKARMVSTIPSAIPVLPCICSFLDRFPIKFSMSNRSKDSSLTPGDV